MDRIKKQDGIVNSALVIIIMIGHFPSEVFAAVLPIYAQQVPM